MKDKVFVILCIFCTIALLSCKKDDKSLAQEAIAKFVSKNANDPHSYESIHLKVDSSSSNYYEPSILNEVISLMTEKENLEEYEHHVDTEKEFAELWNGVESNYARKEFYKYKQHYIESKEEYRQRKIKYMEKLSNFQLDLNYLKSKKWPKIKYAYNKCRLRNYNGNLVVEDIIFILSDDLKEVCAAFDYEQIENIKKNKIIERLASERINYEE